MPPHDTLGGSHDDLHPQFLVSSLLQVLLLTHSLSMFYSFIISAWKKGSAKTHSLAF